jgi:hypothetical protein
MPAWWQVTYTLPGDYVQFCTEFAKRHDVDAARNYWIMKPAGSSRGRGIFVFNDIGAVSYTECVIVQRSVAVRCVPSSLCVCPCSKMCVCSQMCVNNVCTLACVNNVFTLACVNNVFTLACVNILLIVCVNVDKHPADTLSVLFCLTATSLIYVSTYA